MFFNPKTNDETVKCFSCGWTGDIFDAANFLDNLPTSGHDWLSTTIPELSETLGIPLKLGEPSPAEKEKARQHKIAQDISDILVLYGNASEYLDKRNWTQDHLSLGSISEEELTAKLVEKGWDPSEILRSLLIRTKYHSFFGEDRLTFVIKNERGRPVGFISRVLDGNDSAKYINSPESPIYEKSKILLGLDIAAKVGKAKKNGIYIVEGPGDLAQLYRLGILNAAAVCGTAFTEHHLLLLKSLGIRTIYLNFDWDNAGHIATQRVLETILKATIDISAHVVAAPEDPEMKDPDDYLREHTEPDLYLELKKLPAFEWQLTQASTNETPDTICQRMIPVIASESAAVKREILIKVLSDFTGLSAQAIYSDVASLRSNEYTERRQQLVSSAERYLQEVSEDPDNIMATIAQHEQRVLGIEREYQRNITGVNYQLARYDAIQHMRNIASEDESMATFNMNYYSDFAEALSGGMTWTSGCLIYVGGRANSGKTALVLALGCDVALSDPNAIVIVHSTDDSYQQIEPRIKSNLYAMSEYEGPQLTIGMIVQPNRYLPKQDKIYTKAYSESDEVFKDLLANEQLVVLDAEDGSTLSVLERNVRYYRARFPSKKILIICDNTHNYMDWNHLDQTTRMTMISNAQKSICVKYRACMIATAEYRKNMPIDQSKMRLPVDDDLADARALMYRPLVILHVYNDLHDRKEHAEIFWSDPEGNASPRLLVNFTKNKVSGFKNKLVLDLDTKSVTLRPKCANRALTEAENYIDAKENGSVKLNGQTVVSVAATEYEL